MAERISRRHIPVKAKVAAILALAPAALWAACGGGGEVGPKTTETGTPFGTPVNTGGTTESPKPSGTQVSPASASPDKPTPSATATATETPKPELKKIFDSEFTLTTIDTVDNSTQLAYGTHPDAWQLPQPNPYSKESIERGLHNCQFGTPEFPGVVADRIIGCTILIKSLYTIYEVSGYEEFYTAALDTYNYALTELPSRRAEIDNILSTIGVE